MSLFSTLWEATTGTVGWLTSWRPCRSYDWEAGAHYEPDWGTYLGFLFPGEQDLLTIQNRRLLLQLREQGDAPEKPRLITHWLDFLDAEGGEAFAGPRGSAVFRWRKQEWFLGLMMARPFQEAASPPWFRGVVPVSPVSPLPAETRPPFFQARVSRVDAPENIDEVSFTLLDLALGARRRVPRLVLPHGNVTAMRKTRKGLCVKALSEC